VGSAQSQSDHERIAHGVLDVATNRLVGLQRPLLPVISLIGLSFLTRSWQVVERLDF
jgi:hypothetical protein